MPVPKLLIVDANIIFSFFRKDSARKYIIEELLNMDCELLSPEYLIEELFSDKERIKKFSGINEAEFLGLFSLIKDEIKIVPESKYKDFLSKAFKLSPHIKDNPYFALSLFLSCPIWSDEKSFKKQSKVKIFSTAELIKELN